MALSSMRSFCSHHRSQDWEDVKGSIFSVKRFLTGKWQLGEAPTPSHNQRLGNPNLPLFYGLTLLRALSARTIVVTTGRMSKALYLSLRVRKLLCVDDDSEGSWSGYSWIEKELPEDVDMDVDPDFEVAENSIMTTRYVSRKYNLCPRRRW